MTYLTDKMTSMKSTTGMMDKLQSVFSPGCKRNFRDRADKSIKIGTNVPYTMPKHPRRSAQKNLFQNLIY